MITFRARDPGVIENLDSYKATLRGAMTALKSELEPWERKEF